MSNKIGGKKSAFVKELENKVARKQSLPENSLRVDSVTSNMSTLTTSFSDGSLQSFADQGYNLCLCFAFYQLRFKPNLLLIKCVYFQVDVWPHWGLVCDNFKSVIRALPQRRRGAHQQAGVRHGHSPQLDRDGVRAVRGQRRQEEEARHGLESVGPVNCQQ